MTTLIPTIRAEHLTRNMHVKDGYEVIYPKGNKEGQRFFPDDELYLRLPEIERLRGRVVIIHSGMPDPNGGLVELEMLLEVLSANKNISTEIFFSYFAYGMQDHASTSGETNTAENQIRKLCQYYRVKRLFVLDAHFAGQDWVKHYPIQLVTAIPLLRVAAEREYPDLVYMAPDAGSQRRAGIKGSTKKRTDSFQVDIQYAVEFVDAVKDQVIGTIDDLVETGGTAVKFAAACKECGAKDVVALITHGVLVEGIKRIKAKYSKLYLTNSINRDDANVDVSQFILSAIMA